MNIDINSSDLELAVKEVLNETVREALSYSFNTELRDIAEKSVAKCSGTIEYTIVDITKDLFQDVNFKQTITEKCRVMLIDALQNRIHEAIRKNVNLVVRDDRMNSRIQAFIENLIK